VKGHSLTDLSILADLREATVQDAEEAWYRSVVLLHKTLERGPSVTVLIDDRPAAMYGVQSETMLGQQKIWVITTAVNRARADCVPAIQPAYPSASSTKPMAP
jgi:hypothetical protein